MSAFKFSLNYGLITGVVITVYSLILYVLEVPMESFLTRWLPYLFYIIAMFWSIDAWKKKHSNGFASFGQAYGIAFRVTFIAALIGIIYFVLLITLIDPGVLDAIKEAQEEAMIDRGMSDEEIEQSMKIAGIFTSPGGMAIMGTVMSAIFLALLSLIPAAIMKKEETLY